MLHKAYIDNHKTDIQDIICDTMPVGSWFTIRECLPLIRLSIKPLREMPEKQLREIISICLKDFVDIDHEGNRWRWRIPE